jgi:hypothetical protein
MSMPPPTGHRKVWVPATVTCAVKMPASAGDRRNAAPVGPPFHGWVSQQPRDLIMDLGGRQNE